MLSGRPSSHSLTLLRLAQPSGPRPRQKQHEGGPSAPSVLQTFGLLDPPNHLCLVRPRDPKLLILLCPRKLPCLATQS